MNNRSHVLDDFMHNVTNSTHGCLFNVAKRNESRMAIMYNMLIHVQLSSLEMLTTDLRHDWNAIPELL